jgi:hypothetical protein
MARLILIYLPKIDLFLINKEIRTIFKRRTTPFMGRRGEVDTGEDSPLLHHGAYKYH